MNGGLEFRGMVPFADRSTGQSVSVQVWGAFVGSGVDAHEQGPIQQWILNALATSAATYDGAIQDLPARAQEWGGYVSSQLAPQLAQQFQAHGSIQIHGISLPGQAHGQAAPMGYAAPAGHGAPMGGSVTDKAANELCGRLGVPMHQAQQAVAIVMEVLGAQGLLAPGQYGGPQYGGHVQPAKHDPYAKQAPKHDPYAKQAPKDDPYGKQAPKADPYAKQAPKEDPYGKQAPKADPYAKADPHAKADPYTKGAPPQETYSKDPPKGGYTK